MVNFRFRSFSVQEVTNCLENLPFSLPSNSLQSRWKFPWAERDIVMCECRAPPPFPFRHYTNTQNVTEMGTGTTGSCGQLPCPEQKLAGPQTWLAFKGAEGKGHDLEPDKLPHALRKAEGTTRPFLLPKDGFGLASSQNQANPEDLFTPRNQKAAHTHHATHPQCLWIKGLFPPQTASMCCNLKFRSKGNEVSSDFLLIFEGRDRRDRLTPCFNRERKWF